MCLYKWSNKHKIAQEDIVCYKIVTRSKYHCSTYYVDHPIYSGKPLISKDHMSVPEMDDRTELSEEVVHAFQSSDLPIFYLEYITNLVKMYNSYSGNAVKDLALMKCIIPKGTIYYENVCSELSMLSDGIPQYGATKIIPIKIVKYYTHFVDEYK